MSTLSDASSFTSNTRREFIKNVSALPLLAAARQKPNVLVFMTDQESALLTGTPRRPNYELISSRGVRFASAFCNTPQCSPARSSLLTGFEPHHTGVLTNVDGSSLGKPLASSQPTLGSLFEANGYQTGYFGKWHLGNEAANLKAFGFGERGGGTDQQAAGHAAGWIKGQRGPWMAWVSILNPHDIYDFIRDGQSSPIAADVRAPAANRDDLTGKPAAQLAFLNKDQGRPTLRYGADDWRRYRSYYNRLVEKADACLGTVLGAVPDWNNTIIVYTSDHGDELGEHGLPFKGPFMYEPVIRIPLVISAPGLPRGAVRNDFAMSMDVAPTVAGLAGLKFAAAIDGKDLSQGTSGRDAVFLEYYAKQHWVEPIRTIRTERWKMNVYQRGATELYDLRNDPGEVKNVAGLAEFSEVQARLEGRLSKWWVGPAGGSPVGPGLMEK